VKGRRLHSLPDIDTVVCGMSCLCVDHLICTQIASELPLSINLCEIQSCRVNEKTHEHTST
jgi:hypothetical protein